MKPVRALITIILAALLDACAGVPGDAPPGGELGRETAKAAGTVESGFGRAMLTPARDLNLIRDPIPPELLAIENAYDVTTSYSCEAIERDILVLDGALGPDVDAGTLVPDEEEGLDGREAGDYVLDTLSDTAGDIIPFRSIVRRVSGAHEQDKLAREAYVAGLLRRAYLKGMARVLGCEAGVPASPALAEPER